MSRPLLPHSNKSKVSNLLNLRKQILLAGQAIDKRKENLERLHYSHKDDLHWAARFYQAHTNPNMSARGHLVTWQKNITLVMVVFICGGLFTWPKPVSIGIISAYVLFCILIFTLRAWLLKEALTLPSFKERYSPLNIERDDLPGFTILVPLYKESEGIPHLVQALRKLDYPPEKLDIKILLEEEDLDTRISAELHCIDSFFDIITVPTSQPKTKPKACNYGLWLALGEYTVIYDAEDRPEPDQLLKAAVAFKNASPDIVCFQAKLNYYNRDRNWLTRLFTLEYSLLFDILLPGLIKLRMPIPLGGTSNFFKTKVLLRLGGWDPFNVTEDADIGLRLYKAGYDVAMLASTTFEEAPSDLRNWLFQRSRWIKGYILTWLVHSRQSLSLFSVRGRKFQIVLHLFVGGVIVASLINPVFWVMYLVWICNLTELTSEFTTGLFPYPLMEISTITLLAGNFLFIYLALIAPASRRWYRYCPYALLLPVYWVLQSIAGYIAVYQLFRKPYYWEKTSHNPAEDIEYPSSATRITCPPQTTPGRTIIVRQN